MNAAPDVRPRLLEAEEIAGWLATSVRHVQRLVSEKRIPYVKVGHFVRFDADDIAKWIEQQKVGPAEMLSVDRPWLAHPSGRLASKRSLAPKAAGRQAPSDDQAPVWVRHRVR